MLEIEIEILIEKISSNRFFIWLSRYNIFYSRFSLAMSFLIVTDIDFDGKYPPTVSLFGYPNITFLFRISKTEMIL